jgi:hypothetical protein
VRKQETRNGLVLTSLPWRVDESRQNMAYHISWRPHDTRNDASPRDSEAMLGFVLDAGKSWCTPEVELEAGSRLRFEAVSVGRDPDAVLELVRDDSRILEWSPYATTRWHGFPT